MGQQSLPEAYREQMSSLLGEETKAFLDSYDSPRTQGLRINTLRTSLTSPIVEQIKTSFGLKPVPWCPTGFYYEEQSRPGKHPYHAAGLYYIQEPSAMSAAELLAPNPGETVLDLAAAPGGKSTQIAARMQGQGLLISNEIHPQRAKILAENIERMGITNAVVTNAAPGELASRFPQAFDRIMLDAPCSGEGMFRKDPDAIKEWSIEHVHMCAARQWDIVQEALKMLKPGGTLAYSTCTFNTEENEEVIERILNAYPEMELITSKRIWPHKDMGEGHFVALLRKSEASNTLSDRRPATSSRKKSGRGKQPDAQTYWKEFLTWTKDELPGFIPPHGTPILFGESLYLLPQSASLSLQEEHLQGLKIPRAGLHVAELKKNRVEPAHALAMAIQPDAAARSISLDADSAEVMAYLRGETLQIEADMKGWTLVTVDGIPLGWGKASGGQLKNHLPKGLRLF
ncbi:RsmB/NOP family class I SAM-dependent RNA methyltransferase [Paenibacillus sediminis]|uniref:NOL1/NOP2/sun family putative RNA methylase n=1 Tax=Paenibacillus sediminis TaxID=664909 RepID=A0ABS4H5G3_9BACL|nr:RsmB/NOP family class I SAM-dependent RNA methyltransferase [Paenibacillus sediminis]MBP1937721.1 NOL1/NOP2/sun family putative RNA methylase [Paenibacillus sediminis]